MLRNKNEPCQNIMSRILGILRLLKQSSHTKTYIFQNLLKIMRFFSYAKKHRMHADSTLCKNLYLKSHIKIVHDLFNDLRLSSNS